MGYSIKRTGFITTDALAQSVVSDLVLAGFTLLYPATQSPSVKAYTLKAGPGVDPLATTQPWAIKLQWGPTDFAGDTRSKGDGFLDVAIATPLQFTATTHATYERYIGKTTEMPDSNIGVTKDVVGMIGTAIGREQTPSQKEQHVLNIGWRDRTFIDRTGYTQPGEPSAYPMSYLLSVSDRGVVLMVWEQGDDRMANRYSWFVAQRPVDNVDGHTIVDGKAPVHAMYGLLASQSTFPGNEDVAWKNNSVYNIRRFVVREADIQVPYPLAPRSKTWPSATNIDAMMGVSAVRHTVDYGLVINAEQQVSITENNKYVITFPNGLNTARYAYTHEMDMIAYTSADVVSEGTEVPVQVYGEASPRKYLAMMANSPNNTGMRLLVLVDGGGVSPAPTTP